MSNLGEHTEALTDARDKVVLALWGVEAYGESRRKENVREAAASALKKLRTVSGLLASIIDDLPPIIDSYSEAHGKLCEATDEFAAAGQQQDVLELMDLAQNRLGGTIPEGPSWIARLGELAALARQAGESIEAANGPLQEICASMAPCRKSFTETAHEATQLVEQRAADAGFPLPTILVS